MHLRSRYLILLFFILAVILAMFFIYASFKSPEKIVYFRSAPNWFEKFTCIVKGGALEKLEETSSGGLFVEGQNNLESKTIYTCHFH